MSILGEFRTQEREINKLGSVMGSWFRRFLIYYGSRLT